VRTDTDEHGVNYKTAWVLSPARLWCRRGTVNFSWKGVLEKRRGWRGRWCKSITVPPL